MDNKYPETEEHFGVNSQTKEVFKLRTENARLKGEFLGFCKAILWYEIPEKLKIKINEQIKYLEK